MHVTESNREDEPANGDELFYVQQGRGAMRTALSMLEDKDGWKVEMAEVVSDFKASCDLKWEIHYTHTCVLILSRAPGM